MRADNGVQTVQKPCSGVMREAVYNLAILDVASNSVRSLCGAALYLRNFLRLSAVLIGLVTISLAADWSAPEQNLARKIAAVTGPTHVALVFENRSSLGKRDSDIIENGLRSAMQAAGLQFVPADQASANVTLSLSENPTSYVWIAQIYPKTSDASVAMVSTPRPEGYISQDSVPLSLRKTLIYAQAQRILDVAVLEEASTLSRIVVLDPDTVSWYRSGNGRWQPEQALTITHDRPWPRDLRGRLIVTHDHAVDVYLPGEFCTSPPSSAKLDCRQSDDPWPLLPELNESLAVFPSAGITNGASTVLPQQRAFFAPARNFFTGVLTPAIGKFTTVPKFFSAALLPRENNPLWLFAGTDGSVHMIDGASDQVTNFPWGSDLTAIRTACGAGWQVLASRPGEEEKDSIRAYEFPDRDPLAVSPEVEFDGSITALWTESRGDTSIAISRNRETGNYEVFRLAMACSQ
jgi:hypothetical protein